MLLKENKEHGGCPDGGAVLSCGYRLVACPAFSCKKQISYTAVKEHIFGDCANSFASVTKKSHAVLDDRYIQRYTFEREFSFKVSTFFWSGKYFFLSIIKGDRPYANFYVQMLGDEEDCRKLLVTLSVRDQVFCSQILPLPVPSGFSNISKQRLKIGLS